MIIEAFQSGDLNGILIVIIAVQLDIAGVQYPFAIVKIHILANGLVDLGQTLIVIESLLFKSNTI